MPDQSFSPRLIRANLDYKDAWINNSDDDDSSDQLPTIGNNIESYNLNKNNNHEEMTGLTEIRSHIINNSQPNSTNIESYQLRKNHQKTASRNQYQKSNESYPLGHLISIPRKGQQFDTQTSNIKVAPRTSENRSVISCIVNNINMVRTSNDAKSEAQQQLLMRPTQDPNDSQEIIHGKKNLQEMILGKNDPQQRLLMRSRQDPNETTRSCIVNNPSTSSHGELSNVSAVPKFKVVRINRANSDHPQENGPTDLCTRDRFS